MAETPWQGAGSWMSLQRAEPPPNQGPGRARGHRPTLPKLPSPGSVGLDMLSRACPPSLELCAEPLCQMAQDFS